MRIAAALRFAALPSLLLLTACPTVVPNPGASQGPTLFATAFDWNDRSSIDFTGPPRMPSPGFPESYAGLWQDTKSESFDSTIGIRAHDPAGMQSLSLLYQVDGCSDEALYTLTSFNNGATIQPSGSFVLNATPGPQNGGTAPTDLAYPIRITAADLATIRCADGRPNPYPGTIAITAAARNFGAAYTLGYFYVQIGASPLPNR